MTTNSQQAEKGTPQMDWEQVALHGGPPCFAVLDDEAGWFCGRAERWEGHDGEHSFVSLTNLLDGMVATNAALVKALQVLLRPIYERRFLGYDPDAMIPLQLRVADIRQAREALARAGESK